MYKISQISEEQDNFKISWVINFMVFILCNYSVNTYCMPVMSASRYDFDSVVRGFHEYQSIWAPVVSEELLCKHEMHNPHDSFGVAVIKYYMVIGNLMRKFFAIF